MIHLIGLNSCFYLTVKYIPAYISSKTFWQVFLFQSDCSIPNDIIPNEIHYDQTHCSDQTQIRQSLLSSTHPSQSPSPSPIPFHSSTRLFPFSCVQKGFELTICDHQFPSPMIDPNIYKSFHISPIHPNYLSIPWRCQKYIQHELKRESRHVTTIALLATQNPFLFSHFSLTSWHMSSRVEWYGMRWTCVGGHALLCWVVSIIWNVVI